MSIYGVSNSQAPTYTQTPSVSNTDNKAKSDSVSEKEETGVVYEPSKATESADANSTKTDYSSIVKRLKADLNTRNQQLQNLVNQLLNKQAKKYTSFAQLFNDVTNGKISVDPDTVAQAKKDVSEDGYWGVKQTSERLVSMAKALSGGDPKQADKMIAAVKKGFEQAANAWGGELPDICQQTVDAATKELEQWRDGITTQSTGADK